MSKVYGTKKMKLKLSIFLVFIFFFISLTSALLACPDTNLIDKSEVPCIGVTNVLACSGNVSVYNLNTTQQTNVTTYPIGDGRYNFTFNFNQSSYSLVDCGSNSATVIVGLFEEGYGTSIFFFIIPAILISLFSLFVASRYGKRLLEEEQENSMIGNAVYNSKSRWIPTIIILFSFVPMIFMIRIVQAYLENYVSASGLVSLFSNIYIFFSYLFYFIFLVSIIVIISEYIKTRRIRLGLADEN